ncbi:MAG: hypothetical protein FD143_2288 [Ignavibacteria bacterium]|nr:MAG: hypothetical protein FD143_2288 [Ignavibacteria bacterium]KAF0159574.1 MAG: hypothetical protein FD188_2175 [Ignavibacteria bacterium]
MNTIFKQNIILAVLMLSFAAGIIAQEAKSKDAVKLFIKIEDGIGTGSVDKFSNYFSQRNYLSFTNGAAGYYSANQSYYVIKDFLSVNRPISFKITNMVTETATPFAAGTLKYISNGIRTAATVFISLQMIDNQWRISQITIN